ncbi:MAG: Crp/Fnr family transcriptional regulator [Bacteroidales bacterium]|nr:Crp/Fnr family transcriptional regulator [Bacteroidales bacterium]
MDKISRIKNSIAPHISLTDDELSILCDLFEVKTFKKNDFFLKEGQICKYIGLINSGLFTYFKTVNNDNKTTVGFGFEGDWITNTNSRLYHVPSIINIAAIENSELLVITQQNLSDVYKQIPQIERLARILIEQAYIKLYQLTIDLQIHSAKERYENLLKNDPKIFTKVPLYHIANYLGINPKSLSRIRKKIFKN